MIFYSADAEERPVRLNEQTRCFAWESLHGKYGNETMRVMGISMDDVEDFDMMTPYQQYDLAIKKIAEEAPIRVCDYERVSGAATLGYAILHSVPATYKGKPLWYSVSHTTLDFAGVVRCGLIKTEKQVKDALVRAKTNEEREILESMINVIDSLRIWHRRYLEILKDKKPDNYASLLNVPFQPASSFLEAVQSLWFLFAFTRLCGNWSAIGRIDEILGSYLKEDLDSGRISLDEAREILASFFIKGCEWIESDTKTGTGDAQHYQNIVLSGVDASGIDVTNHVTYLVLDIVEELGIGDFPITIRISDDTDRVLLEKAARVIRHGGGVVALYNEKLIINALTDFGYPLEEARSFANDGCWEVIIPGKTLFGYKTIDSLQTLLNDTLGLNTAPAFFENMDDLYEAFIRNLQNSVEQICNDNISHYQNGGDRIPCSVVSLFVEGCIENARSYLSGGTKYVVRSPHIGGAPDVGNSLYAISKLVYEDKLISFGELMSALQNNWKGYETLRLHALNKYIYYGNDDDGSDAYTARVLDDFADIVASQNNKSGILFPPGVSTFGRQVIWADCRNAVPFGKLKGDVLSGNASPTPGTDISGATAVIKSYCKANLRKQVNGSALDVKLHPSAVRGANGIEALVSLMKGFIRLGGFFMQLDVMDAETLRLAQERPDEYKTLSVRVSGWNARFITLNKEWQDMIINRTAQGV